MVEKNLLYKKCERCEGDGTIESGGPGGGNIPCERCGGDGEYEWGWKEDTDIMDNQNDIKDKLNDIWQKLNEP